MSEEVGNGIHISLYKYCVLVESPVLKAKNPSSVGVSVVQLEAADLIPLWCRNRPLADIS